MRAQAALTRTEDTVVHFDPPADSPDLHGRAGKTDRPRPQMPLWIGIAAGFALLFGIVISQQSINRPVPAAAAYDAAAPDTAVVATAGAPDVVQFLASQIGQLRSANDLHLQHSEITPLRTHLAGVGAPTPKPCRQSSTGSLPSAVWPWTTKTVSLA